MRPSWRLTIVVSLLVILPGALAQNTPTDVPAARFQLAPTRVRMPLWPGERRSVELEIRNTGETEETFALAAEDFSAGERPEDPTVLHGEGDGPSSARRWLAIPADRPTLGPGERWAFTVTARAPADAAPGDHYAAVLVTRTPTGDAAAVDRVGSLFLLSVPGGSGHAMHVQALTTPAVSFAPSVPVTLLFRNDGDTYAVTDGRVVVRNMLGTELAELSVPSVIVLRDGERIVDLTWQPRFAIGRYTVTATIPGTHEFRTAFWVLPVLPIAFLTLLLCGAIGAMHLFFRRFEVHRRG